MSLIFSQGRRPSADDVLRLVASRTNLPEGHPGFAISHRPAADAGWLELIAAGLTFDLAGLTPADSASLPAIVHWYGFPAKPELQSAETITLVAGEHVRGGENLLPVVRTMAAIGAQLVALGGVETVVWHPARTASAPDAFVAAIATWLNGGAFPALGLTALYRDVDGAVRSEGLGFFIGQELRIEPLAGETTAQDAKVAARLIHQLVGNPAIDLPFDFIGPNGEKLSVASSGNGRSLRVWRKT